LFRTTLTINFNKTYDDIEFPKYISWPITSTLLIEPSHKDIITSHIIKNKLFSNTSSTVYLPIKVNPPLGIEDNINFVSEKIASPLGQIVTTLGLIVGSIAGLGKWFLSQKKVKEKKDDI
ncbi:MAG TPA: hypothetical protein VFP25_07350, partial [Nitrososphaeraceae archaeon]|nr:hypothetical protein [Nitrososphaeraceae archaeon]